MNNTTNTYNALRLRPGSRRIPLIRANVDDIPTAVADAVPNAIETRGAQKPARANPVTPAAAQSEPAKPVTPRRQPNHAPIRSSGSRLGLFWPLTFSLVAGIAAIAAGGFTYQATARFQIQGNVEHCRRELLALLWQEEKTGSVGPQWRVPTTATDGVILARITMPTAEDARTAIAKIGDQFRARLTERADIGRANAGEATRLLDQFLAAVRDEADEARTEARNADDAIADASPFHTREALRAELATQVESVNLLRTAKGSVEARLTRIDTSPLPAEGWVSPAMKQSAYAGRGDLNQDMEQLAFQLKLGRRLLEDVWQEASPRLDELIAAAARLARIGLSDEARSAAGRERQTLDDLLSRSGNYQRRLTAFAQEWTESFTGMRRHPVDPVAARLLTTQSHLHDLLGNFLFASAKLIENMRHDVERLTQQTHGAARYHELHSHVKTAFYRFESEHRQFELVSSNVLRRNNFRLDAGIKSAAGLHRRTQQIIAAIDAQLEEEAIARAVAKRKAERKIVVAELEEIRSGLDASVDQIIALQADFLLTIPQSDRYLESTLAARAAHDRLTEIDTRIAQRLAMTRQLKTMRSVMPQMGTVEVADYTVDRTPANLTHRFGWGIAAACATFATTLVIGLGARRRPWA